MTTKENEDSKKNKDSDVWLPSEPRHHPRSLAHLLWFIRKQLLNYGLESFPIPVAALQKLSAYTNKKGRKKSTFSNWERNKYPIQYRFLEGYAHLIDMPVGVLLLISRMSAELSENNFKEQDAQHDSMLRIWSGLGRMLKYYEEHRKTMQGSAAEHHIQEHYLFQLVGAYHNIDNQKDLQNSLSEKLTAMIDQAGLAALRDAADSDAAEPSDEPDLLEN